VTVGIVERAYHADRGLAHSLLTVEELPESWRRWARSLLEHQDRQRGVPQETAATPSADDVRD
jgi:hypothetical protein